MVLRVLRLVVAPALLCCASSAWAAVAVDNTGVPNIRANAATTIDLTTVTVGVGANDLLIAFIHFGTAAGPLPTGLTITWDPAGTNQALTQVTGRTAATLGVRRVEIWRLVAPTTGNKTLRASWTNANDVILGAMAFSGVDQTTPIVVADNAANDGSSSTPSVTITSTTDGATAACIVVASGSVGSTQTQAYADSNPANISGGADYAIGGTSNVHSDTSSKNDWAMIGVHVQAVQTAAAVAAPAATRKPPNRVRGYGR